MATRTANTPSFADVNGQVLQSQPGDTVKILAGNAMWTMPAIAGLTAAPQGAPGGRTITYRVATWRSPNSTNKNNPLDIAVHNPCGVVTISNSATAPNNFISWTMIPFLNLDPSTEYYEIYRGRTQTLNNGQSFSNFNFDSATANFTSEDVGGAISGTNIPAGTIISSVTSATRVVLSKQTTGTGTNLTFTITALGVRIATAITDGNFVDGGQVPLGATPSNIGSSTEKCVLVVNKNIRIVGAGPEQTIITTGTCLSLQFATSYQAPAGATTPEVELGMLRINSNGFVGPGGTTGNAQIRMEGWSQNIRLHHLAFNANGSIMWIAAGWTYGVMDHCYTDAGIFLGPLVMGSHGGVPATTPGVAPTPPAGVDMSSDGQGDVSYTHRGIDHWATANAWYFEDNVIQKNGHFFGSYEKGGVWYVSRHNSTHGTFSGHGNDTTGPRRRSERSQELYNNFFAKNGGQNMAINEWRGSSGNSFNNRFGGLCNKPWTGGGDVPFAVDSYRSAANYGSPAYNANDGTGLYDTNDRSTIDIFTGAQLPDSSASPGGTDPLTGKRHGQDSTIKPCVPGKGDPLNPYGTIFAAGTGATENNPTGTAGDGSITIAAGGGLPANLQKDQLIGYTIRNPDISLATARAASSPNCSGTSKPRYWAIINGNSVVSPTTGVVTLSYSNDISAGSSPSNWCPVTFGAGGKWEIRRVLHVIDEPGSGKTDLITGSPDTPNPPSGIFNLEWEYIYQWGNQVLNGTADWDNATNFMDVESATIAGVSGVTDFWGDASNQQNNKANQTSRGLKNGVRTVGYNTGGGDGSNTAANVNWNYPVQDLTSLSQAQKDLYRRIGADDDPLLPAHDSMVIKYETVGAKGKARVPSATTYWGFVYPHPLVAGVAGSISITSAANTTFTKGSSNSFTVTTSGASGAVTFSLGTISGPGGITTLPTNVTFNTSTGKFTGDATGSTVGDYTFTITAAHAPETSGTQDFLLRVEATNKAPTVSISTPTDGAVFSPSATVTVKALASDDSAVAQVEFFDGTTSLGAVTTAPYTVSQSFTAGTHVLTAVATDNGSPALSTTSASVTIYSQFGPPAAPNIAVLSS